MKYIIHSNIEFDTTNYVLTLLNASKTSVKLSNPAGRILEELIKHQNTDSLVTREHLFTVVWKSYGLEPSHGNLNQQVSLIRKTLTAFGLNSSCIITIPKRGLKLSNQIIIKTIQNNVHTLTNSKFKPIINSNNNIFSSPVLLSFKTYISYIITLTIMIVIIFSMSLIFLYHKKDNIKLYCCKEINSCSVCPIPATAEPEYNDNNLPYFEVI